MASGYGMKQEESEAISLMLGLESMVNQRSSQHASSSFGMTPFYQSHFSASDKFTSGDGSYSNTSSSGYSTGNIRPSLCGTSQLGNSLYDKPLDMTMAGGRAIKKEPDPLNFYGTPSTVSYMESTSQATSSPQLDRVAHDIIESAMKQTGLDFKTPIPSHPNSAFQAVTPSTSGAVVSDPMEFLNRPNAPPTTNVSNAYLNTNWIESALSTSGYSTGDTGNQGYNIGSSASTSQSLDGPLQSFLSSLATGLAPPYSSTSGNSDQGVRASQSNSGIASNSFQSTYMAGPSTSSGCSSQVGSSSVSGYHSNDAQQSSQLSSFYVVMPPATVEQSSGSQQISNSTLVSSNTVAVSGGASGVTSSPSESVAVIEKPPSPEEPEPTFSCIICLDSVKTIQSSSRHLCSTVCGHVFCSACLDASLKRKKECPMCRKKLGKKQYHPLFL